VFILESPTFLCQNRRFFQLYLFNLLTKTPIFPSKPPIFLLKFLIFLSKTPVFTSKIPILYVKHLKTPIFLLKKPQFSAFERWRPAAAAYSDSAQGHGVQVRFLLIKCVFLLIKMGLLRVFTDKNGVFEGYLL
jgi:hypothetical protein